MSILKIGYDVGTKTIKAAYGTDIDNHKSIRLEHYSDITNTIEIIEKEITQNSNNFSGYITGRYRNSVDRQKQSIYPIDWTKPVVQYCNDYLSKDVRYIIDIGASGLSLIELKKGKFHRFQTNSICASGTGSFLDQQMIRMGLTFDKVNALNTTDRVPGIASRCAVFAKSDLIHRQQEGYSIDELWNGLVKGMAESCYITLLRGSNIDGKILLVGGLVNNSLFLHYFSQLLEKDTVVIPDEPDTFLALACLNYAKNNNPTTYYTNNNHKNDVAFEKPLNPEIAEKTYYETDHFGNERKVYQPLYDIINNTDDRITIPVVFGVDIGSTSTKAAIIHNESGELLLGFYRKTSGNPISAYQKILKGINSFSQQHKLSMQVKGMGTTGSGRKIVGAFAGADSCVNEITAHLKGGLREVSNVKTIIEIGGQDSKYIYLEDGWMKDANMNYVCAAGTGSFLEEQAQNLNIGLDDFEDLCRGVPAPKSNDRCTVFMEQDCKKLIVAGHSKSEIAASLLYSVCRNYLHRVVQNRQIEEPILFLGATARNKGLVEAFSNILQKEIITIPNSHLTGAIGVAEIIRQENQQENRLANNIKFKGFSLDSVNIEFKEKHCNDCHNKCRIIYFDSNGETVSWGYQCGKEGVDKEENQVKNINYFNTYKQIHKQELIIKHNSPTTIYIPKILSFFSHNYLWQVFWQELGINVSILPDSNKEVIDKALNYSPNELCFPIKMAIGHIVNALNNNQAPLFVPYLIRDAGNKYTSNSYFCPMTQSIPSIVSNILNYNGLSDKDVYSPIIDLSNDNEKNIESLYHYFKSRLNLSKDSIRKAFNSAIDKFEKHQQVVAEKGSSVIKKQLEGENSTKPKLVIIGRGYNLYDDMLNLGLIKETAKYGYDVIPADLIPFNKNQLAGKYQNMYWTYGQRFIAVAKELVNHHNLYPILLTNFNCGPDSFILSMLENIWKDKPCLILELDEHSGNAGYLTRIEAFLDRVTYHHSRNKSKNINKEESKQSIVHKKCPLQKEEQSPTTLLIPPMNPFATQLVSNAFKGYNYNSIPLLKEDTDTFQLGKSQLRGSECMPAASTIGSVLHYFSTNHHKNTGNQLPTKIFMPCASGPCRFGQYTFLHKMILERNNINADILSLNSENYYEGFSTGLRAQILRSIILTDLLMKIGLRLRPYEKEQDNTDKLLTKYLHLFSGALEKKQNIFPLLKLLQKDVKSLALDMQSKKPLVGIVGEIYVRNSPFSNDNLVNKIENYNAEVWLTPFMEWLHYIDYLKKQSEKPFFKNLKSKLGSQFAEQYEKFYFNFFNDFLNNRKEPTIECMITKAEPYISEAIRGEAVLTVGRALCFIEQGVNMIVNVAPFGCMPGTVSSIILKNIAQKYSIPIVSLYYDGFVGFDSQLEPYLNNLS